MNTEYSGVAEAVAERRRGLIVVVDDDEGIGEIAEMILQMEGYETRFFDDPEEALAAIHGARVHPDLLLTDFHMGHLDGMQLLHACRMSQPDLKCILCSGIIRDRDLTDYVDRPDSFVAKPFTAERLVETVHSVLQDA